jgi:hypothetical protein
MNEEPRRKQRGIFVPSGILLYEGYIPTYRRCYPNLTAPRGGVCTPRTESTGNLVSKKTPVSMLAYRFFYILSNLIR